jgi:Mg2+/Co2+ transporter CorB
MGEIAYNIICVIALLLISGFFSSSETGMMSLNRYRLRHHARKGDKKAQRIERLLGRPDRLLGTILVGNTFANVLVSALVTMMVGHYLGDGGVLVATIILTVVILIFAETAPKTLAAWYPEKIAFTFSWLLQYLQLIFYPFVWFVNTIANRLLRVFGFQVSQRGVDALSMEELRTIINEATGKIGSNYQKMLLRIIELERMTVEDVMVPRNEIYGIDLDADWDSILMLLSKSEHAYLPLYRDSIDQVEGILNLRKVLLFMHNSKLTREKLMSIADKVYYVPEGALLNRQLLNFQTLQQSIGLVVDEYGEIQGLVTLQDVVEEVVGEFAYDMTEINQQIQRQKDGSVIVNGAINIRDLNRFAQWNLPVDGPKTLSGLVIEYLEMMPKKGIACRIAGYPMEVLSVENNIIQKIQVWPELLAVSQNSADTLG